MTIHQLAAIAAAAALLVVQPHAALAHEGHSHGASNVAIPETADGILAELQKHHAAMTAAVTGKNLKAVHDLSETMTALARALPDKAATDKKETVQRSTNNLTKLLDTLHHAADAGDQPRSGIELKKVEGVMTSLEKQLK